MGTRTKGLAVTYEDIERAASRIQRHLPPTPLTYSPSLSEIIGHDIYVKWDNKHRTGSFKERGAVNVIEGLSASERKSGVCAASLGNHALALSFHAARAKVSCTIVMPRGAPLVKVQSTMKTGASVIMEGNTFDEAYRYAMKLSQEKGCFFVSAFDDPGIIAGQGTLGMEVMGLLPDFDSIVVPVGGGGLISGVSLAIKESRPDVYIRGVQSEWAVKARSESPDDHKMLIPPQSIADGIAVKTIGKNTGPIIKAHVDELIAVSEGKIARAIISFLENERAVIEGGGAAGLAGVLADPLPKRCKKTVIVASGSNIDMNVLARLINRDMGERGRLLRVNTSVPDRPGSLRAVTGILAQAGANVLEVTHDRSFTRTPGNVAIAFVIEVRDQDHKKDILFKLNEAGIESQEI